MPTPKQTTPKTPATSKDRKMTTGESGNSRVGKKPKDRTMTSGESGKSRVDAPSTVKTVDLSLDVIIVDCDLQMRAGGTDEELVEEYRAELLRGTRFPPVGVCLGEDGAYYLYSGFTRTEATRRAGNTSIQATVQTGGKREAMLLAVAENASHGKRRTRADVQRAIEALLLDAEWGTWSDGQIATSVSTDPKTVGAARRRLVEDGRLQPADVRRGRDGRTYQAPRKPATKGKNGAVANADKPVQVPTAVHATDPVSEMFGAHTDVVVNDAEPTVTELASPEPNVTATPSPEPSTTSPTSDPLPGGDEAGTAGIRAAGGVNAVPHEEFDEDDDDEGRLNHLYSDLIPIIRRIAEAKAKLEKAHDHLPRPLLETLQGMARVAGVAGHELADLLKDLLKASEKNGVNEPNG